MPKKTIVANPSYIPYFPAFKLDFASFKQVINPFLFPKGFPNFDPLDSF
jgi:hypothetical protein